MTDNSTRTFTLAEANTLVRLVADITADVVQHLDSIRQRHQVDFENPAAGLPESVLKEVEKALAEWSQQVMELGVQPKGYFTVDFRSLDPELLYCWTYGEEKIEYTHKVWENFNHRQRLAVDPGSSGEHLKWVN
jgi:hypothetical protein